MKTQTVAEICEAVGGRLLNARGGDARVEAVCSNSRQMEPSSVFIAIKGETFDGHDHLQQAAAGGAIAAIVQDIPAISPANLTLIQVPNTRTAMGDLARHVRRQLRSKVIAVAGSNGKTSTKHLVHSALRGTLRGSISPKSFNNDIGVPLTLFPADPNDDYLVLEMGTNHHGEILKLTEMAEPDIAVITNAGAEHLEFLGDLSGVRRENATVVAGLNPSGLLVVNGDDEDLLRAVANYPGRRVTFGFNGSNDLYAQDIRCTDSGVSFCVNGVSSEFFVPMLGRHSACNALAAIAVARHLGVSDASIRQSLAEASAPEMRLQLQHVGGLTILNDAYNANPNSMRAALETTRDLQVTGRRVAILGDMRELGPATEQYHRDIGRFAATCKLDMLCCVGGSSAFIADAAAHVAMPANQISHFATAQHCATTIAPLLSAGDLVLLKASRSIRLEIVAAEIAARFA